MSKRKNKLIKTDPATGYAIRVGGPWPYVSGTVINSIGRPSAKEDALAQCTQPYHRPIEVVTLTTADFRRLCKAAGVKHRLSVCGG
jgi:hypothetical protein